MKNLLILVLALSSVACTSQQNKIGDNIRSTAFWPEIEGAWHGHLQLFTSHNFPGSAEWEQQGPEVFMLNCSGKIELWVRDGDPNFYALSDKNWRYEQLKHNYSMHFNRAGGDWIETQFWGFSHVNDKKLLVQNARLVNNPELKDEDDSRAWGVVSFGELKKYSDHCDVFEEE